MEDQLAIAQALKYAEELRELYGEERSQRRRAETAAERLVESYATTVRALATALELRDDTTGQHADRVTRLALRLAERVAPDLLADPRIEYGFLLHDVGKIGIPDAILLKPGALTPEETAQMRRHTTLGEQIVASVPYLEGAAREIVAAHHERWDGRGYPHGLSGHEIPIGARIFALVDTYDAMTNARPYRDAVSPEAALAEIEREAGRQFDPHLAVEFAALVGEREHAA